MPSGRSMPNDAVPVETKRERSTAEALIRLSDERLPPRFAPLSFMRIESQKIIALILFCICNAMVFLEMKNRMSRLSGRDVIVAPTYRMYGPA